MGNKLGVAQTRMDGSERDMYAKLLDPAGVCIQATDLEPFQMPEDLDVDADEDMNGKGAERDTEVDDDAEEVTDETYDTDEIPAEVVPDTR
mmetsp:Transcript_42136/g.164781  ORF Transcript_42136/g.164781 Transcript_42136/m.164781 type:complete len:91 (+) Transcript_42136:186-458(+)|eukprot:CAMPEP_0113955912 /NCGR_PEP_ID=MMETSP0011_2-20120614/1710_1 /TAXON_ID=101924 /ORGANISM="Rhodosorus marinus" /LENGTH=90 /DNA_ID=CAMNT_0000965881 /DNA_START=101 /DNA_END=373 /DNA_ORIENTATION=+ /assembly_acc=CAM_ASM_000156